SYFYSHYTHIFVFFFTCSIDHRLLHSFPTRRSSDLLMDPDLASFTGPHPIPVRTGMTIGEFARMAAVERNIPVSLTIVPLEGWERGRWFDETGLPWVNPSPNIRSLTQALLYAGIGLLESTNVSVGRGTERP